jgi:hypothetical protein
MFGCLRRVGCLAVLLVIGVAGWLTRDEWLPRLVGDPADEATVADAEWSAVTRAAAEAGRAKVARLAASDAPAGVALLPAEVAGYVLDDVLRQLASTAQGVEAAVIGDRVYVRAAVRLQDFGAEVLGPLGDLRSERDTLMFGGTFGVLSPGVGQFRVADMRLGQFTLPQAVVPRLLRRLQGDSASRPAGLADDALAIPLPPGIVELRVGRGRVSVYGEAEP